MNYTAETMLIHSKDSGATGVLAEVSAAQAGWEYLNMAARRMDSGQRFGGSSGDFEYAHVILGGSCNVYSSRGDFLSLGQRANVFSGKPSAVYLPRDTDYEIEALTDGFEVASCWVPADRDYPAQRIDPKDSVTELRGGGNASRQIQSIIPPGFNCQRIVAVEVYTPSGNWSSYPPHKHDVHREDAQGKLLEADLEEIYFYKVDKPEGCAYQRVYTDDRSIDGLMMARDNDLVLVPEGYHPVVAQPGYTVYYLNFLAGSAQSLANVDDPAFTWFKSAWGPMDPRLPIIR